MAYKHHIYMYCIEARWHSKVFRGMCARAPTFAYMRWVHARVVKSYICIVYIYIYYTYWACIRIICVREWVYIVVNGPLIYLHNLFCGAIHTRTIKRRKNVENLGYPMNYIDHTIYICVCTCVRTQKGDDDTLFTVALYSERGG